MSETLIFEDDIGTAYEDEPSVDPDDATVVLAEQTLTFDGTDPLIIELSSPLVVGQTYRVMWDGTPYTSTAAELDWAVFIGNAILSGIDGVSDTGEPFAVAYSRELSVILTLDAGDHTVAIYQEVEDVHASNDAVILSYSQNPVEYKAVPKVWLTHPDSTEEAPVLVPFTYGELLEDVEIIPDFKEGDMQISVPDGSLVKEATIIKPKDLTPENIRFGVNLAGIKGKYTGAEAKEVTVDLDFSEGDMVIAPEEDKVFSTVKIPKPGTLIPENIAKGVDIAGIVGTLAAGSGGVKVAIGTIVYYAMEKEYTHNLGVIPDVIIYVSTTSATAGSTAGERYLAAFAISDAFASKNPSYPCGSVVKYNNRKWYSYTYSTPMDQATTTSANRIFNVTETTFTITSHTVSGVFIAIAGLT